MFFKQLPIINYLTKCRMILTACLRMLFQMRSNIQVLLAIFLLSPSVLLAQNQLNIRGKILDGQTNTPMPDVNVVVKGTKNGVKTAPQWRIFNPGKTGRRDTIFICRLYQSRSKSR